MTKPEDTHTAAGGSPLDGGVRPSLMTEGELLEIVDTLIRDRAFNRPAAIAIGMAIGAAVEAEVRERCAQLVQHLKPCQRGDCDELAEAIRGVSVALYPATTVVVQDARGWRDGA